MPEMKGLHVDFHAIDLSRLKSLLQEGKLEPTIAEALLNYWQKRLDDKNDAIYSLYIEYYLFFESLKALFLAVFIFDMKNGCARHSYGIFPALAPAIQAAIADARCETLTAMAFDYNGKSYTLHYFHSSYHEKHFAIAALASNNDGIEENLKRLKYVFERFYLPSSFSRDSRIGLLFPETQNSIAEWVNPTLARGEPVTFTYLYFESLTKYIGQGGENFAFELLDELKNDVHRVLKDGDRSIVLSTREILVVSLNCETEILKKRFANAYFHAKSLLLAFQTNFFTVRNPITDLHALWSEISGDIAYKRKLN